MVTDLITISRYNFSEWNGEPHQYGQCEMVVDFKDRKVQPPKNSRGAIARTYLYMHDRYEFRLSKSQERLLRVWAEYPVSDWDVDTV